MPYIDFKELKESVSITAAAELLKLKLRPEKKQFRGCCPACNAKDDRSIVITPERGLFYCFEAREGGDCLALVQHVTGLELKEAAEFLLPQTRQAHSSPKKEKERPNASTLPSKPAAPFDPGAFAAKLAFTDEVEALGIDEDQARLLGVGVYRGRLYSALRYPSGVIAGFQYVEGGKIVFPKTLLPDAAPNVVAFKKRA